MNVQSMLRLLAAGAFLVCVSAHAAFTNIFVIGDSVSDSGDNAIVLAPNITPVSAITNSFVPAFPYASGHYTNGAVWAQLFAASLGLSAAPVLAGGTDFAFGGARAGPFNPAGLLDPANFPPSLLTQTAALLAVVPPPALSNALFVVEGGGNDARDALGAISGGANIPATIAATAAQFAANVGTIIDELQAAGGNNIVVWNAPNVGLLPAVRAAGPAAIALGTAVSASMNTALSARLASETGVRLLDIFGLVTDIVADPAEFGLLNVTDACGASATCDPSKYLFWDGIHPTSAGHALIASAMIAAVPEPSSFALGVAALLLLVVGRSKRLFVGFKTKAN